jgi:hypothetical protein
MSKTGRPPLLDDKKKAEILAILATGCGRRTAAYYVSCDPKTIYNTAKRNAEFAGKLARNEHYAEITHLNNLHRAGKDLRYWRASTWVLERLFPQKYGTRAHDAISPQQLTDLIERIAEMIVEEVPVAKYRKQILARFQILINQAKKEMSMNK